MTHNTLYQKPPINIAGYTFDEMLANNSPDTIKRSVSGYKTIISTIDQLAGKYTQTGSCYCNIGSSTSVTTLGYQKQQLEMAGFRSIKVWFQYFNVLL